jgi:hypothetical protein
MLDLDIVFGFSCQVNEGFNGITSNLLDEHEAQDTHIKTEINIYKLYS